MRFAALLSFVVVAGRIFAAEADPAVEAGINVTLEGAAGLRGGARTGESLQGLTIAHLGWHHQTSDATPTTLRAYASLLNHEGRGPTGRFVGDFLAASNIEAFDSTRLYACWFEAEKAGWSVRAGALLADEEFAGTDAGGQMNNSVFGWPAFISANTVNTGPAFSVAAPGVRVAYAFSPEVTWRSGIYDGNTFDSPPGAPVVNRHGYHFHLGGAQGWFLINEVAYAPTGSPARFKLGVWHHTATFSDQYADRSGQAFAVTGRAPRDHSGNTGVYGVLEHTLAGEAGKPGHVGAFARIGAANANLNTLGWALDTGLAWTGPIANHPTDVAAIAFAHADFSSPLGRTAALLNPAAPRLDAEQVIEATYTAMLNEHFKLKPDLQFIRHPGGSAAQRDAVLAMLRVIVDF